jgi:hypothetical protein
VTTEGLKRKCECRSKGLLVVKVQPRKWRGCFDDRNRLIGIVEQVGPRWHAYCGGMLVGIAETAEQAAQLMERERACCPNTPSDKTTASLRSSDSHPKGK